MLSLRLSRTRVCWGGFLVSVRTGEAGLLGLSLVVGVGAGLGAVAFRWLIVAFTQVLSGHVDYSGVGRVANPHVPWLGPWFLLLAPVVAGAVYGPLVHRFAREARGHGVPEVMYAVARRGGRIAPQVAVVKALASALCIGGGGSVGREGPIVQIGSALGSALGSLLRVSEQRMRVLVACGAAGGIAATFNAPLAGVFFASELVLRDFTARSFGMVVISAVISSVVGRGALGDAPFLTLPTFTVDHLGQYLLFALLGLLAGGVGVGFTKVLYLVEDACDAIWPGPEWLRPAAGGVLLGGLLLALPQLYGVGYPVLEKGVGGGYVVGFLVVLLVGKVLATSLTIGIGGSGGVFAPSLFVGAMLGAAFGEVAAQIAPGTAGPVGAYGLIGMGAVFAGAARAPITAVIILFELTGEYSIILPLMLAIVLATGVSHLLTGDSIYSLKLRRRGVDLDEPDRSTVLRVVLVGQVMEPVGSVVRLDTRLLDLAARFAGSARGHLPVVDQEGRFAGVVSAEAVADTLADGQHDDADVARVVEAVSAVRRGDSLEQSLDALNAADGGTPVLADDSQEPVGWLTHQRVLAALAGAAPGAVGSPG